MTDTQRIDVLMEAVPSLRDVVEMIYNEHEARIAALEKEVNRLHQQQTGDVRRHDAWLVAVEDGVTGLERRSSPPSGGPGNGYRSHGV